MSVWNCHAWHRLQACGLDRGTNGYALACKARILRQVTVIGNVATRLAWLLT